MDFGFIGAGNMATAIISGVLLKGYIKPKNIYIYDIDLSKMQNMSKYSVEMISDINRLVLQCDCVFLTVKPQVCKTVLESIAPLLSADKIIVSVAAGITIETIRKIIGPDRKVIRVMPNTPLLLGAGASALVFEPPVSEQEFAVVKGMFGACGMTETVSESDMDAVTAVSGSAPAYVFKLAHAVMEAAKGYGLSEETALRLFSQTLIGSAKMLLESGLSAEELIKMVASPNGTTVAALCKMDEYSFDEAVSEAVNACARRSAELSRG